MASKVKKKQQPPIAFRLSPEIERIVKEIGDPLGDKTTSKTCQRIVSAVVAMYVANRDAEAIKVLASQWPRVLPLMAGAGEAGRRDYPTTTREVP